MHYKTIAERFQIENAVMSSNYFKPLQVEKSILYVLQRIILSSPSEALGLISLLCSLICPSLYFTSLRDFL